MDLSVLDTAIISSLAASITGIIVAVGKIIVDSKKADAVAARNEVKLLQLLERVQDLEHELQSYKLAKQNWDKDRTILIEWLTYIKLIFSTNEGLPDPSRDIEEDLARLKE